MNYRLKNVEDLIAEGRFRRIKQSLQNLLKITVGITEFDLTKYDRIQTIDTTGIKYPNQGGFLIQHRLIKCNYKKKEKKQNF